MYEIRLLGYGCDKLQELCVPFSMLFISFVFLMSCFSLSIKDFKVEDGFFIIERTRNMRERERERVREREREF